MDAILTNEEIARRLRLVVVVKTGAKGIRNEILHVGEDHVVLQSQTEGSAERTITFDMIRNAAEMTSHGVIVRVLAQILGLYEGDYE